MVDLPTPAFWQAWVAKAALSPTAKRTDHGGDQWSAVGTKPTFAAIAINACFLVGSGLAGSGKSRWKAAPQSPAALFFR